MHAMSLKATVRLAMAGAAIGSVLATAGMTFAYATLERAQARVDFAGDLCTGVAKLNLLTAELTFQRSAPAWLKWEGQYRIVQSQINDAPPLDARGAELSASIMKQLEATKSLTGQLVAQPRSANSPVASNGDAQATLVAAIVDQSGKIRAQAGQFGHLVASSATLTRKYVLLGIGAGFLVVLIGGVTVLLLLCNRLLSRILNLRSVVQAIGHGHLDADLPTDEQDEMGDVARELDQMRLNLLNSMAELSRANLELLVTRARLEDRVCERTANLQAANRELESFAYAVSHDLRAPLRAISGFSLAVLDDYGEHIGEAGQNMLRRVHRATQHMNQLIEDLLNIARLNKNSLNMTDVGLSKLVAEIAASLRERMPERQVTFKIQPDIEAWCDERLMSIAFTNLIENAWKFTSGRQDAEIEFGREDDAGQPTIFVRDNGAGFDMAFSEKLFQPFQRLHSEAQFPGTGIGLATVARILRLHGGKIWADSAPGKGAAFYVQLCGGGKSEAEPPGPPENETAEAMPRRASG